MNRVINGNVIRALQRIKISPNDAEHLVDEEYIEEALNLVNSCAIDDKEDSQFNLQDEFTIQYNMIKEKIKSMGAIETKDDLDVIKEAQKFLTFIMRNEEKLAEIEQVKAFKEAVLETLDAEDPELKDRVIRRLSE